MKNETDVNDLIIVANDSGFTRWAPLVVVLGVVGGFVMLSWYAYHAGIQSVKEEDLVVIEADKTPMKEKPTDPGGMQFPNQDKTVFETISNNSQAPAKVERVLPVPEEPMAKDAEASGPTTWVNKDIHKSNGKEQVIGKDSAKKITDKTRIPSAVTGPDEKPVYTIHDKDSGNHQVIPAQEIAEEEQSVSYVASKKATLALTKATDKALAGADKQAKPFAPEKAEALARAASGEKEAVKAEEKIAPKKEVPVKEVKPEIIAAPEPAEEKPVEKPKAEKKIAAEAPPVSAAGGNFSVQLGAYRSHEEAEATWDKLHLKTKELSDKKPSIIRADLGDKGVYYRLRVGGLASAADAKALCHALTAKGQACIIPTGR